MFAMHTTVKVVNNRLFMLPQWLLYVHDNYVDIYQIIPWIRDQYIVCVLQCRIHIQSSVASLAVSCGWQGCAWWFPWVEQPPYIHKHTRFHIYTLSYCPPPFLQIYYLTTACMPPVIWDASVPGSTGLKLEKTCLKILPPLSKGMFWVFYTSSMMSSYFY